MDILTCMENLSAIKESKNLKEASQKLFIEQSTLSKRISRIENHFNTTLVNKDGNENRMTESGEIVLQASKEISNILNELDFELRHLANGSIATTIEHYLRTSLIHIKNDRIKYDNDVNKLIDLYNNTDISCLIIEEIYEDQIEFSKKSLFTENQLEILTGQAINKKSVEISDLNNYEIILHAHTSYSDTMYHYIKLLQKKNILSQDLVVTRVDTIQVLLVDLLLNPNKAFLFTPGIIIPEALRSKLYATKVSAPEGQLNTYKYFK